MGGDNGVACIVGGIARALKQNKKLFFLIHGKKSQLEPCIRRYPEIEHACSVISCKNVVNMNEKPSSVLIMDGLMI